MYQIDEKSEATVDSKPLRRVVFLALGLSIVLLFGACSDEARDNISDAIEGGGDTTLPEEAPPEEPPPPTEGEGDDEMEEGLSSEDLLVVALLGAGALGMILLATSLVSNHSRAKEEQRSALNARLDEITGGARWVHDQASIDVLRVSDPAQLREVWNSTRGRMIDLEGNIAALVASVGDRAIQQLLAHLGLSVSGLRGALESNVSLRLDPDVASQDVLLQNSTQAVYDRRQQLQAAIMPIAMARL